MRIRSTRTTMQSIRATHRNRVSMLRKNVEKLALALMYCPCFTAPNKFMPTAGNHTRYGVGGGQETATCRRREMAAIASATLTDGVHEVNHDQDDGHIAQG